MKNVSVLLPVVLFPLMVSAALLLGETGHTTKRSVVNTISRSDALTPASFASDLEQDPQNEPARNFALQWHGAQSADFQLLKSHTFEMIEYHPANPHILFENTRAFYVAPAYRLEVIKHLENRMEHGDTDHRTYWLLSQICEQGAIPPLQNYGWRRKPFLSYYHLPENTVLPTQVDKALASKAIRYNQAAIIAADNDPYYAEFYASQLLSVLKKLGRSDEAEAMGYQIASRCDSSNKSGILLMYGRSLKSAKCFTEAKHIFNYICAHEKGAPSQATMEAETQLGLISVAEEDISNADAHLIASCEVQRGIQPKQSSLLLAKKLLGYGQAGVVAQYCQTILTDFAPGHAETSRLLLQAQAMLVN
jgi:hypothetical protein